MTKRIIKEVLFIVAALAALVGAVILVFAIINYIGIGMDYVGISDHSNTPYVQEDVKEIFEKE